MADGNILAAKRRLSLAVRDLCDPIPDGTGRHWAPPLLEQLRAELPGSQGDTKSPGRSLPPLWVDSLQLLTEIDGKARIWHPEPGSTIYRLQSAADKAWRPQDTDLVKVMARTVQGWTVQIRGLLDPVPQQSVSAACPCCGRRWIYRKDSAGEMVRQPALRISATVGCICQGCEATWTPDRYLFLVKLLGFELPEGVLE